MNIKNISCRFFRLTKEHTLHHINHHRLEWACVIAVVSFTLGWIMHSEAFRHFAEVTLVPVLEVIINRKID